MSPRVGMVFDDMPGKGTEAPLMWDLLEWWRNAPLDGPKSERLTVVRRML
jgi:hypothetical protein